MFKQDALKSLICFVMMRADSANHKGSILVRLLMYFWLVCISSSKITHSGLERNKTELGWMCTISPLSKALYVPSICLCAAVRKNDAARHLRYSSMSSPQEDTLNPICSTFPRICLQQEAYSKLIKRQNHNHVQKEFQKEDKTNL